MLHTTMFITYRCPLGPTPLRKMKIGEFSLECGRLVYVRREKTYDIQYALALLHMILFEKVVQE